MRTHEILKGSFAPSTYRPGAISPLLLDECVAFRTRIYIDAGYIPQPEQSAGPDCYDAQSTHICVRDRESGALAGYCRMIHDKPYSLPIAQLYPELGPHLGHLVEISRFSVVDGFRGNLNPGSLAPVFLLGRELLGTSHQLGIDRWCCLIDERFQQLCLRFFKMKFHILDDPIEYLGSPCVPCIVELRDSIRNNMDNPELAEFWNIPELKEWIAELN